ncbi:MAG: hypothetical protein KGS61_00435 [Verrucomicrobia bacterium]|nr:hypothetical protein [Verrucomicrobiota bacterium]
MRADPLARTNPASTCRGYLEPDGVPTGTAPVEVITRALAGRIGAGNVPQAFWSHLTLDLYGKRVPSSAELNCAEQHIVSLR